MRTGELAKLIASWTLPHGLYEFARGWDYDALRFYAKNRNSIFARNSSLKDIHRGKRCFIMGNGPSTLRQNLLPLKDEIVFTVSNGYHHRDYQAIKPRYHCSVQVNYDALITESVIVSYFKEMDNKTREAELFISGSEYKLIAENSLFANRNVNYLCFGRAFCPQQNAIPDITKVLPKPQSAPLMVLMIAMYMGFKEIYLIGVEHDWIVTKEYKYAFESTVFKGKDISVSADGKALTTLTEDIEVMRVLWSQYGALRNIAEKNGIKICNAAAGGMLDVYERVDFDSLFKA